MNKAISAEKHFRDVVQKRFTKGVAGPGRPKNRPNFTTKLAREAIIEGLSICGGRDGLVGFVVKAVKKDIRNGVTMLGMVTPKQVDAHITHTELVFQTIQELDQDLAKHGLPPSKEIFQLNYRGDDSSEELTESEVEGAASENIGDPLRAREPIDKPD